ncbi:DUF6443 domain-containing protein [Tenacibaculum jejuense]|uniref:Rhs family protein n=1 Tax=Tenacibaculum jejuense TaxID=584609 RepID=A0A238UAN6_9FLAO|nr:DUF6443 domain-containing protein [Tenacibaculum jejuense]SNR16241.1 Rhs family protein precursor [Tenacibaculum jejuense]
MKKLLYILGLVVPMFVFSQNTNENYVLTKTYKEARTTPLNGHDKNKVMTNIQYFDGLGRLKQSIALEAGGKTLSNNNLPIDWTSGNTGSTGFYNRNGSDSENRIISGTTPFGGTDLLWECIPDATSNADGGWNTDYFPVDNTKTYRYTIWVKKNKVGGVAQGRTYHGTRNVNNLNGTVNNNPYFKHILLPQANTWYLLVGIVHPYNYKGGYTGVSGVYDVNGNKISNGTEFTWRPDTKTTQLRSYLYYTTDTSVRQYFWSPLFQEIDGSETSLNAIVNRPTTLVGEEQTKDIITHVSYDALGRQTKEYLPFTSGSNNANLRTGDVGLATQTYYGQKYAKDFAGVTIPVEINAYSEKSFDNSPLNRVLEQAAPGSDWKLGNNHEIRFDYQTNGNRDVRAYYVTTSFSNNTYTPTLQLNTSSSNNSGYYKAGELYKTITKDENWTSGLDHTTEEFKNKQGQVVLKRTYNNSQRHDTYYVYDDFGNLTYVIPPKSEGTVSKPTSTKLNELCYQYKYDYRNRLVEKKIPGKGWEYIVYDRLDRPVMTQDANLKAKKQWLFTKYDKLGRVVYTGIYYDSGGRSRTTHQVIVDNYLAGNTTRYFEDKTNSKNYNGVSVFYSNKGYPNSYHLTTQTINYYDTYVDLPSGLSNTVTTSYGQTSTSRTKGLATVTKVRVLGTNNWITTVSYYDEKARPIYVYSKNDYLNTIDIVESKLDDFTGKVLETKTTHKKTGKTDIITVDRFEYDHMDRLVSQNQQVNNQTSERIVKNNYDDLGQLESKLVGNGTKVGYKDVTSGLSISNNIITKTGAIGWSHALATQGSINGDGYVEFISEANGKYYMAGLSSDNTNSHFSTIDFAIYVLNNSRIFIYESGSNKGQKTTHKKGDILRVERIGDQVHYKKNGETFYISEKRSSGSLLGDISMYHNGAKIKDFKIVDNSKGLQKVDYKYNVRGWLTNINEDVHNDNDLFNFSIKYNDSDVELSKRLYNGNIAQTRWQTENVDKTTKTYNYSYDALNRITNAIGVETPYYDLFGVSYDKNGNILKLHRHGYQENGVDYNMDRLTYGYFNYSNKLKTVSDAGNKVYGFKDGTNTTDDYAYDANGNMIIDKNKKITNIRYNHLNLPISVSFEDDSSISYKYDASGVKLYKQSVNETTGEESFTSYAGNYIYERDKLQFFNHPEGYVKANVTSSGVEMDYVYQYKDHLGNVRLSYTDNNGDGNITQNEIIEESNYYPFGLKHKGYNNNVSSLGNSTAQKFGYNGIEYNESLGLNLHEMDVRSYDPAIARWTGIDPVIHYDYSPYQAFDNNPVYWSDPSGADSESEHDKWVANVEAGWRAVDNGASAHEAFGNGASNEEQGNNSENEWLDLTKNKLLDITRELTGITADNSDGKLNDIAGDIFEQAYHEFANARIIGYHASIDLNLRGVKVPDGKSSAKFIIRESWLRVRGTLVPDATWHEVKAKNSRTKIKLGTREGSQMMGFAEQLVKSNPPMAKRGYLALVYATTSDTKISPKLRGIIKLRHNIKVTQFIAQYRKSKSGYEVRWIDQKRGGRYGAGSKNGVILKY